MRWHRTKKIISPERKHGICNFWGIDAAIICGKAADSEYSLMAFFFLKHAICRQKSRSTATLLSWVAPQRHLTLRFVAKVELFFVVNVPDIKSWEIESYLQLHVRTNSRFKNHVWFYQLNRYILHYLHMYSILQYMYEWLKVKERICQSRYLQFNLLIMCTVQPVINGLWKVSIKIRFPLTRGIWLLEINCDIFVTIRQPLFNHCSIYLKFSWALATLS